MGLFEQWPYVNFHDLNLDWVIKKIKHVETAEANSQASAEASAESAAASQLSAESAQHSAETASDGAETATAEANDTRGTATEIRNEMDLVNARLDNLIITGTPTEGNAELIDIRVAADGSIYETAGNSVRGQIENKLDKPVWTQPLLFEIGNTLSNGVFTTSQNIRAATRTFYKYSDISEIICPSGYKMEIDYYTQANESAFISYLGWLESFPAFIPNKGEYVRFVIGKPDNTALDTVPDVLIRRTDTEVRNYIDASEKQASGYQYLIGTDKTDGYYYNRNAQNANSRTANANCSVFEPFRIKQNTTYYFNNVYGYFSSIVYDDGTRANLKDTSETASRGSFTAAADGMALISIVTNKKNYIFTDSLDAFIAPSQAGEGVILTEQFKKSVRVNKTDDTADYSTIKEAMEALSLRTGSDEYTVNIDNGTYDILSELGGEDFVRSITAASSTRSGITVPDHVKIKGNGTVLLTYLPDDSYSTYASTERVSPLEVYGNIEIDNIHMQVKNCRYCIHDESNNNSQYANSKHVYKNCFLEHLGNMSGGWVSCDAIGQGSSSGNHYEYINCKMKSASFYAFGCHNNANQQSNILSFDGCVFDGNWNGYALRFGYYLANTERSYIFFKNCQATHPGKISAEAAGSDNVYELINFTDVAFDIE